VLVFRRGLWLGLRGAAVLFCALALTACGSANNKTSTETTTGNVAIMGNPVVDAPVFYDPATRFAAWGSADPVLKATPLNARDCAPRAGDADQTLGNFKVYSNNCVMSYQVSPTRFDQILREGNFYASELLEEFSQRFKDDFDFIVLSLDTNDTQPSTNFRYSGQYQSLGTRQPTRIRRLMGHVQIPFGVGAIDSGPFLHEIVHEWGQRAAIPDMGSDEGHWGDVSTQGQLGGFDPSTLLKINSRVNANGQTIFTYQAGVRPFQAAPGAANPGLCTNFTRSYGLMANGGNSTPVGPFELFLMGLVPATQVPPLIRLQNPVPKGERLYGPGGPGNSKSVVSLVEATGESVIELETVRQRLGAADPAKQPFQNEFRAAYITITPNASLSSANVAAKQSEVLNMAQLGAPQANIYQGCVVSHNLFTATQGLATIAFGGLREARR
jgi:hypothetical protein